MKVHLRQIPAEGLHLSGEEECLVRELEETGVRCAGPLRYDLDLGISEGALWANGSLSQPIETQCVACLEPFKMDIEVPAFTLHTELHGPEALDLTPFMREDILLNLPAYPHCDREGGRVCQAPARAANPAAPIVEESATREEVWGALNKLKIRR